MDDLLTDRYVIALLGLDGLLLLLVTYCLSRERHQRKHFIVPRLRFPCLGPLAQYKCELLQADLEHYAKRHEQINVWRYQFVAPIIAIYTAVLGAVAFIGQSSLESSANMEFLLVGLITIILMGICVYVRLAIGTVYAVDAVYRRRELNYVLHKAVFDEIVAKQVDPERGPERYFRVGSHFFNDTMIAVLNSGVATTLWACCTKQPTGQDSLRLNLVRFFALLGLHVLSYILYLSLCAIRNMNRRAAGHRGGLSSVV